MIDPQARPGSYIKLLLLVVGMGIASALITFAFILLVEGGTNLVWEKAANAIGIDPRLFTFLVCSLGGLIIGLLVKVFGDHSGIFYEVMHEFGRTGRFDYRNAPGIVITAFFSLVAGGSLGPEAPLADACGGIGTLASDQLKLDERETRSLGYSGLSGMLGSFITSPFGGALLGLESAQGGTSGGLQLYFWLLFPSLLSAAVATAVFVALSGHYFGGLYRFPDYTPHFGDMLLAVPLGLVGGIAGLLFMLAIRALKRLMLPLNQHVVVRGLIGGMCMGLIGALLPLTMFSGEAQTHDLIANAASLGFTMLVLLAIAKLFTTAVLLTTGWKGGYLFPILFAGVALGLAMNNLFPNIPTAVVVAATLAGAIVATLQAPLFAALFTLVLVQIETAPVIAVAVVSSALLTALLGLMIRRREEAKMQVTAAEA